MPLVSTIVPLSLQAPQALCLLAVRILRARLLVVQCRMAPFDVAALLRGSAAIPPASLGVARSDAADRPSPVGLRVDAVVRDDLRDVSVVMRGDLDGGGFVVDQHACFRVGAQGCARPVV